MTTRTDQIVQFTTQRQEPNSNGSARSKQTVAVAQTSDQVVFVLPNQRAPIVSVTTGAGSAPAYPSFVRFIR